MKTIPKGNTEIQSRDSDGPQHPCVMIWVNATGDVVAGDVVAFTESVFGGSFRKPRFLGERKIVAMITKDSYGVDRQQHTFTLSVIYSEGYNHLATGTTVRRKGRNVYRNETERLIWQIESDRREAAKEKHARGDLARSARDARVERELNRWGRGRENGENDEAQGRFFQAARSG